MLSFASVLTIGNTFICLLGVAVGIIIGALPGLTPTMGVALLLPVTFSMDTIPSFALLLGIYVGGTYGGSISAILIRTPGTPQAVATVLDGYPLARSGKASEALSAACIASGFGGIFSNIVLICLAGQIAKVALAFGPAEYFAIGIFGLSMVASFCA
ncbi:MAG TPA: C4-dicarboxylate ABC transporter permease, partial [Clostridiales bacterium]|nr:C4-dicarboxylate ABC transporter permease [Clostridiales bacterium]